MSNWNAYDLKESQIEYAATDAYVCINYIQTFV